MPRPLLAFVSILKNEAKNIRATLESVKPFIDYWAVALDTSTTDETEAVVKEVLGTIPGVCRGMLFEDFSTQRNRALDLIEEDLPAGERPVFTLMLSGDEVLQGGQALRDELERFRDAPDGAYAVMMASGPATWPYPRVLRVGAGWKYEGAVHERPVGPDRSVRAEVLAGARIIHSESDLERKRRRLKEFDLPTLTRIVEDEAIPLMERTQAIYHLAMTHAAIAGDLRADAVDVDIGPAIQHDFMAMALYLRYAKIAKQSALPSHDLSKAFYAYFMALHIADKAHIYEPDELEVRLQDLVAAAPRLAEARFLLADVAARIDTRTGLHLALEAVNVAREIKSQPGYEASDVRIEWLSLALAARCAKAQKKEKQAASLAEEAIRAGAPKEMLG